MKKIIAINGLLLCSIPFFGQSVMDAVNYLDQDIVGTARYMGMAGAFGALGGDITTLSHNPAGIGVYRSSEVVFTGALGGIETRTSPISGMKYSGADYTNSKFNINANTLGYVGTYKTGNSDGIVTINFGFSYNRLAGSKRRYKVTQNNMPSALSDFIAAKTNQWSTSASDVDAMLIKPKANYDPFYDSNAPWLSIMGYNKGIINYNNVASQYESAFLGDGADADLTVDEHKSIDEYTFNIGGNISNMVYWGLGIGVIDMDCSIKTYYDEYYWNGSGDAGNYMLDNYLDSRGTGLNVKMGLILRPTNSFRLGVAVHTPTWYNMTDEYGAFIESDNISSSSPGVTNQNKIPVYGYYDYKFQTPWKFQFSAAAIMGSAGIFSAEYELSNYGTSKFKNPNGDEWEYEGTNSDISALLKDRHTLKLGTELRLSREVSLRLGFANKWSAYDKSVIDNQVNLYTAGTIPNYVIDKSTQYYTGGLGYRLGNIFADVAFVWKENHQDAYLMPSILNEANGAEYVSEPTKLSTSTYNFVFTVGYKF